MLTFRGADSRIGIISKSLLKLIFDSLRVDFTFLATNNEQPVSCAEQNCPKDFKINTGIEVCSFFS